MFKTLLLLLLIVLVVDCGRQKRGSSEEEEDEVSPADWEDVACALYDRCLQTYDDRSSSCGHGKDKDAEESDSCYEPIRKQFSQLANKKERKNQLLRLCYLTGRVEGEKKNETERPVAIGKRHRASCRQKFGEMEQFFNGRGKNGKAKDDKKPAGSCHGTARRIKERCQKIESCCLRVKTCRLRISQHTVVEQMRDLEAMIKDERRKCREMEYLH